MFSKNTSVNTTLGEKIPCHGVTLGVICDHGRDYDTVESEITVGGVISVVENAWSVGETVVKCVTDVGSEEAEKCWVH